MLNKFDEIVHEFKDENKKTSMMRGWIIVAYVIGSVAALWILMFATIGGK